jgi:hypothetical protein
MWQKVAKFKGAEYFRKGTVDRFGGLKKGIIFLNVWDGY